MPSYEPSLDELNDVRAAVGGYNPHHPFNPNHAERQIDCLIEDFNNLIAAGAMPVGVNAAAMPPALNLPANDRSRALAVALAIMRPDWDAAEALNEFRYMRNRLLEAWRKKRHQPEQKLRKTVDEVVAYGSLRAPVPGWPLAHEVVYREIHAACMSVADHIVGPPNGHGLIPDLNAAWGQPFKDEVPFHASEILSWLQLPYVQPPPVINAPVSVVFSIGVDGCDIDVPGHGIDVVPPGSRRNLLLVRLCARLQGPRGFDESVPVVRRLMLRSLDERKAEIQLAELVAHDKGVNIAGPTLKLTDAPGSLAQLSFEADSDLQVWECPCGRWTCDREHRLSVWDPSEYPPDASLRTFLWTAVKGKGGRFLVGTFIESMYYALLREGA
jgi:hypothetical protein